MAGRNNAQRTSAERARLYTARTDWHAGLIARRVRDNTIVGIVAGLLVVGSFASQAVHAQVTAPEPIETGTPTPTPTLDPLLPETVTPTPTDAPAE